MSDSPKRRPSATYLGTVPTGTIVTPKIIQQLIETQPRQPFDIEIKPNASLPSLLPDQREERD